VVVSCGLGDQEWTTGWVERRERAGEGM